MLTPLGRVLVFVVLLVAGEAVGLATWSNYVIGGVAGLAGECVLGDAGRLPNPFDEPAKPDRPQSGADRPR